MKAAKLLKKWALHRGFSKAQYRHSKKVYNNMTVKEKTIVKNAMIKELEASKSLT